MGKVLEVFFLDVFFCFLGILVWLGFWERGLVYLSLSFEGINFFFIYYNVLRGYCRKFLGFVLVGFRFLVFYFGVLRYNFFLVFWVENIVEVKGFCLRRFSVFF